MSTASAITARPLSDQVIIRRESSKKETEGGIVLPDAAQNKQTRGVVLAVGPGPMSSSGQRTEMQVDVGDNVVFDAYAGTEIEINDETVVVIREYEILMVL